ATHVADHWTISPSRTAGICDTSRATPLSEPRAIVAAGIRRCLGARRADITIASVATNGRAIRAGRPFGVTRFRCDVVLTARRAGWVVSALRRFLVSESAWRERTVRGREPGSVQESLGGGHQHLSLPAGRSGPILHDGHARTAGAPSRRV